MRRSREQNHKGMGAFGRQGWWPGLNSGQTLQRHAASLQKAQLPGISMKPSDKLRPCYLHRVPPAHEPSHSEN